MKSRSLRSEGPRLKQVFTNRLLREKLNEFLASRDISPIRHSLDKPWIDASERTKPERRDKLLMLV